MTEKKKQDMLIRYSPQNLGRKMESRRQIGSVLLAPGSNLVDTENWDETMKNKIHRRTITRLTDNGVIEVIRMKADSESIDNMSIPDAKILIKDTFDPDILRKFLGETTNNDLKIIIGKQLTMLTEDSNKDE